MSELPIDDTYGMGDTRCPICQREWPDHNREQRTLCVESIRDGLTKQVDAMGLQIARVCGERDRAKAALTAAQAENADMRAKLLFGRAAIAQIRRNSQWLVDLNYYSVSSDDMVTLRDAQDAMIVADAKKENTSA